MYLQYFIKQFWNSYREYKALYFQTVYSWVYIHVVAACFLCFNLKQQLPVLDSHKYLVYFVYDYIRFHCIKQPNEKYLSHLVFSGDKFPASA